LFPGGGQYDDFVYHCLIGKSVNELGVVPRLQQVNNETAGNHGRKP